MNFFQEFITDICSIGNEFKDRIMNIPNRGDIVMANLPTALTGFLVVIAMLALIAVVIYVFSKVTYALTKKKETVWETGENSSAGINVPSGTPLAEGNSAGKLDLVDVDEPTAAVIMAIVSDQSGIPLNRLNFKSIKKVEDK